MKKGKVKFYNVSKGYGFLGIEGEKDHFFHATGHHTRSYDYGKVIYTPTVIPNKEWIQEGLEVSIISVSEGKEGSPMASQWYVEQWLTEIPLYAVVRREKVTHESAIDPERRHYIERRIEKEIVLFIGDLEECRAKSQRDNVIIELGKMVKVTEWPEDVSEEDIEEAKEDED